jgi:hypothetical protein
MPAQTHKHTHLDMQPAHMACPWPPGCAKMPPVQPAAGVLVLCAPPKKNKWCSHSRPVLQCVCLSARVLITGPGVQCHTSHTTTLPAQGRQQLR